MNSRPLPPPPALSINNKDIQFLEQETTTLLVKNLPNLSESDLLEFLKHFGPQEIRLGTSNPMKNSAFLDYPDRLSAANAFSKLQELGDIGGKKIRVEYALPSKEALQKKGNPKVAGNSKILYNIMNAIAAVPKLYTQVLHLMNKMNLPPPFGPILPESIPALLQTNTEGSLNKKRKKRDELLSDDESEIDSEVEEEQIKIGPVKKPRVAEILPGVMQTMPPIPVASYMNPTYIAPPIEPITPKVAPLVLTDAYSNQHPPLEPPVQYSSTSKSEAYTNSLPTEDKAEETANSLVQQAESPINCLTLEELNNNKMLEEGLIKISAMKNYEPGRPNSTLYIKNLAKKIKKEDLEYIFGRYFHSKSQMDIRLHSRGQAFVIFPDEEAASRALNDVHGYILHNKPMNNQNGRDKYKLIAWENEPSNFKYSRLVMMEKEMKY
ncbi:3467_t:CDS:2 [Funneliformis geosporum]|nr:3467_t:CDS:2 [Funneliformis geosporum]